MTNLFDIAKEKETTKKIEKNIVVEIPQIAKSLKRIMEIDEKLSKLQEERDLLDLEIRKASKNELLKLYNREGKFPGSIKIDTKECSFQFITQDKYLKIDQDKYDELKKKYNDELINKQTKYLFNEKILEKYKEIISEMIIKSKKISDEDKKRIIESETTFSIKKGSIEKLYDLSKKFKTSIDVLMEEIKPIFSVKFNK